MNIFWVLKKNLFCSLWIYFEIRAFFFNSLYYYFIIFSIWNSENRIWGYYDNRGAKIWPRIHNLSTKTNWNLRVRKIEIRIILPVFRCFSLKKNTGFLALRCILSQRNPKCTTWLDENVTNRVASIRSADRHHLSFLPLLWLPHCVDLWLLFRTCDEWTSR